MWGEREYWGGRVSLLGLFVSPHGLLDGNGNVFLLGGEEGFDGLIQGYFFYFLFLFLFFLRKGLCFAWGCPVSRVDYMCYLLWRSMYFTMDGMSFELGDRICDVKLLVSCFSLRHSFYSSDSSPLTLVLSL